MTKKFRLLMISAMYENGGNTTHRLLDGHSQMYVYPFESQLGTARASGPLASMFPAKYRWPVFDLEGSPEDDFRSIIDEECRVRANTPHVSKFRHMPFDFSDKNRKAIYLKKISQYGRSRANSIRAFFEATFEAWKDCRRTGSEQYYVGYSPIVGVDAPSILSDLPTSHILHIVRNPWSAYAETKRRPVPMSLKDYLLAWTTVQHLALIAQRMEKKRFHILRYEDIVSNPLKTLGSLCRTLGLRTPESLKTPSWNGNRLSEVYPWGTIRNANPDANRATSKELSAEEIREIRIRAEGFLHPFQYEKFIQ